MSDANKPAAEQPEKAVRVRVSGTVQGVGFRAWTVNAATKLGLEGWVRNRTDGTVEIQAVGAKEKIDTLLYACRKGPPLASVANVQAKVDRDLQHRGSFVQKGTA